MEIWGGEAGGGFGEAHISEALIEIRPLTAGLRLSFFFF